MSNISVFFLFRDLIWRLCDNLSKVFKIMLIINVRLKNVLVSSLWNVIKSICVRTYKWFVESLHTEAFSATSDNTKHCVWFHWNFSFIVLFAHGFNLILLFFCYVCKTVRLLLIITGLYLYLLALGCIYGFCVVSRAKIRSFTLRQRKKVYHHV